MRVFVVLVSLVTSVVSRVVPPSLRVAASDRAHAEASSAIAFPETEQGPGSLHTPTNIKYVPNVSFH